MEKNTKLGFFEYLFRRVGYTGLLVGSFYLGYKHSEDIGRIENNLTKKNLIVEQGFYHDPIGLGVDIFVNEKGHQEVYLVHRESGKRIPINENVFSIISLPDHSPDSSINNHLINSSTDSLINNSNNSPHNSVDKLVEDLPNIPSNKNLPDKNMLSR